MKFNKLYNLIENVFEPASAEEVSKRQEQYTTMQFDQWLEENEKHMILLKDGSYDVHADVKLGNMDLDMIPIKFHRVTGDFRCDFNKLQNLKGCPDIVEGDFNCEGNDEIENFEYFPKEIRGDLECSNMLELISLEGLANLDGSSKIGGSISCDHGNLYSLKGVPKEINGFLSCMHNRLNTYDGFPELIKLNLWIADNPGPLGDGYEVSEIRKICEVDGSINTH